MPKPNGRARADKHALRTLKMLHKFGTLRARDAAALTWLPSRCAPRRSGFDAQPVSVTASALRMAQKTLARLRDEGLLIVHDAPDGSTLYGLAEPGARKLRELGIPASSSKSRMRRMSESHYHHRRLCNELAILGLLQGYRVKTEFETAAGLACGGMGGVHGKKGDILLRHGGGRVIWGEIERSRKNGPDAARLLTWLQTLWPPPPRNIWRPAPLPDGLELSQILFFATPAFLAKLSEDLRAIGWPPDLIAHRIRGVPLLYPTQATFITLGKGSAPGLP